MIWIKKALDKQTLDIQQAGNFVDALAYMRSVGGLVDRVVDKLQAREGAPGSTSPSIPLLPPS